MEEGWTASSGGLEASYSHGVVRVEGRNETSGWINILNRPVAFINNPILLPPGTYAVADHLTVCIKPGSMQLPDRPACMRLGRKHRHDP